MTKHRLELFSDGVFAIVLTLLALDLKVPSAHGLTGLAQIAPGLLVHAATFFIVGVLWMTHHGALARVDRINSRALLLNLVALFWATLLPFAARVAAERPLEPLGASLMAASCGAYFLSFAAMRLSLHSAIDDHEAMRAWRRRRITIAAGLILTDFCCALLSWLTPWAGYAAALATMCVLLLLPSPPEEEERFEREAVGQAAPPAAKAAGPEDRA
ncbi:MAG: Potassium channel [Alphaproteobacteria bacterium]|nr:Potassium channel [Alphaproteobacteria bacterium]